MLDDTKHQERLQRKSHPAGYATSSTNKEAEAEGVEASCGAFGYPSLFALRNSGVMKSWLSLGRTSDSPTRAAYRSSIV